MSSLNQRGMPGLFFASIVGDPLLRRDLIIQTIDYCRMLTQQSGRSFYFIDNCTMNLKMAVERLHPWSASSLRASENCCFVIRARLQSCRKRLKTTVGL
jgi:hypothetical protein